MRLSTVVVVYLLLPFMNVFAHEGEESITVVSEADWVGPLVAVLIVAVAIVAAKMIKKSR